MLAANWKRNAQTEDRTAERDHHRHGPRPRPQPDLLPGLYTAGRSPYDVRSMPMSRLPARIPDRREAISRDPGTSTRRIP